MVAAGALAAAACVAAAVGLALGVALAVAFAVARAALPSVALATLISPEAAALALPAVEARAPAMLPEPADIAAFRCAVCGWPPPRP